METFTSLWMPYINFIITLIVGFALGLIIRHKNSLIKTLMSNFESAKQLLELYDASKFKEYTTMVEETLKMKHEKELKETIDKTIKTATDSIEASVIKYSEPWITRYDELMNFHVNMLINMPEDNRERYLSFIPKNRDLILQVISDIKEGQSIKNN